MTGFGIVAGAPLACVAAFLGIVYGSCAAVACQFERKISKHERTVELAKSKLSTIIDLISKALNDGRVSQEEFSLIVAELDKFRHLKAEIREKSVADPLDEETKNALIRQGTDMARVSFIKKMSTQTASEHKL